MEEYIYENQSLSHEICEKIIELFNKYTHGSEHTTSNKKIINLEISSTNISETNDFYFIKNILVQELEKNIQSYYNKLDNNNYFFNLTHTTKTIHNFLIKRYINIKTCEYQSHDINNNNNNFNNNKININSIIFKIIYNNQYINNQYNNLNMITFINNIKTMIIILTISPNNTIFMMHLVNMNKINIMNNNNLMKKLMSILNI